MTGGSAQISLIEARNALTFPVGAGTWAVWLRPPLTPSKLHHLRCPS